MLAKRNGLTELEILSKSMQIQEILIASRYFEESKVLGVYISRGSEVRTQMIIDEAFRKMKTVAIPRVIDTSMMRFYETNEDRMKNLVNGKFGIPEPTGTDNDVSEAMDLLIVPGIAFDLQGYRLGHGMGYYDNFLRKTGNLRAVGLAFDVQVIKKRVLPRYKYDMKVDNIVTEIGIL
jgi:5-formyltetrahydrofolate cyclo-ligase